MRCRGKVEAKAATSRTACSETGKLGRETASLELRLVEVISTLNGDKPNRSLLN